MVAVLPRLSDLEEVMLLKGQRNSGGISEHEDVLDDGPQVVVLHAVRQHQLSKASDVKRVLTLFDLPWFSSAKMLRLLLGQVHEDGLLFIVADDLVILSAQCDLQDRLLDRRSAV